MSSASARIIGEPTILADDVDVALVELPVPALLRALRPPHRADLQGPERHRQVRLVGTVEPGERDGQVVAQAKVHQVAQRRARLGLSGQATLEDLEDQLLVVSALAGLQPLDVLQRRRLDPLVAVPAVDAGDGRQHMIPGGGIGGQQVPHPPGWAVVGLHQVVPSL
jgi:hypothetical protein